MATCWNCGSFAEESAVGCEFCGASSPAAKPGWIAVLDTLPGPQDPWPHFGRWYAAWQILLTALGIWYWPWWAALGAMFLSAFLAVPATMVSSVLVQQAAQLWRAARPRLILAGRRGGLLGLEEQTETRLRDDQEAFDALVGIMNRERRHRDLRPEAGVADYRKRKVLPVFGQMVRLSVSALLEIQVRRLLNECEQLCDGLEDCRHREINRRYERLEAMHRELGAIKLRWSGYLLTHVATPEVDVLAEHSVDPFDPRLQPEAAVLAPEDLACLQRADDTLRTLRHALHQTQELQLLRAARPLTGHSQTAGRAEPGMSGLSALLREIQAPDRLRDLEREYQRIVGEQRTIQDTPGYLPALPAPLPLVELAGMLPEREDFKKRVDAQGVLSNSLARP